MKKQLRKIFILLSLVYLNEQGFSQGKQLITVTLNVIGKQNNSDSVKRDSYLAIASIKNNQDSMISFWIMGGGWPLSNWQIDNHLIAMNFPGWDINIPIQLKLLPEEILNFSVLLQTKQKLVKNIKFKMGFRFFRTKEQMQDKEEKCLTTTFWSNYSLLENDKFIPTTFWVNHSMLKNNLFHVYNQE